MEAEIETRRMRRGTKRVCKSCEERFYDLGRDPTVCPMCRSSLPMAAFVSASTPARTSYSANWSRPSTPKKPLPVEVAIAIADGPDNEALTDETSADDAPAADADVILEPEDEADGDVSDLVLPDDESSPDE